MTLGVEYEQTIAKAGHGQYREAATVLRQGPQRLQVGRASNRFRGGRGTEGPERMALWPGFPKTASAWAKGCLLMAE